MSDTLEYILKKYDLPRTGAPIQIPNVGRLDLLRWFKELNFKVGAEIGVDEGNYSKLILETNNELKLYAVDPWLKHDEYHEYDSQEHLDRVYNAYLTRMKNEIKSGRCVIVRKKSMDALGDFKDESLDFVYIDANHEGEHPYNDLNCWAKKVRKGGIIAGHDFIRPRFLKFTIKDALEKYTKEHNINPWFILGWHARQPGVIRDRSRSWVIVK
jgi:SAM-dependent methyltransferase